MHLFEVTDDDKDLADIHGRHDIRNFCSLHDDSVDLSDKSPFVSVDIKDSMITPIFVSAMQVLMKSHHPHSADKLNHHHNHKPLQGKHRHNALYVCRHTNPPKRRNVRLIGDFCLWTPTKESAIKWLMALGDPLTVKSTNEAADPDEIFNGILDRGDSVDKSTSFQSHVSINDIVDGCIYESCNSNGVVDNLSIPITDDEVGFTFRDEVMGEKGNIPDENESICSPALQEEEQNEINRVLALEAAEELEEEERRRQKELEDLFNATLTEEEKEENRRTQEEEEEVERLLALEAAEEAEAATTLLTIDDTYRRDREDEEGNATLESVKARRSLVEGVNDFVSSQ